MAKRLIRFDWAMKKLLRDKANFDILEGFLSALLEDEELKILHLLESESNAEDEQDKYNRVDLLCEDSQQRKIYIEIQNTRERDYMERLLYATSKIIVENQRLGEDFSQVSKVISVSILYFNLGLGDDYLYYGTTVFKGMNTGNRLVVKKRENLSETFAPKYTFVEKQVFPEYYLITVERYKNIVKKWIDEWVYIFKNNEVAEGSSSKHIDKVEQKLAEMNMTDEQRKRYENYLISTARDRGMFQTATEDGIELGIKKGVGKVAQKMKRKGRPVEEIMEFTGLTQEQVEQLPTDGDA